MSILSKLKTPSFGAGGVPKVDEATYRLRVEGLIREPFTCSLEEIKSWPRTATSARLTSVSGWSVRATWEGVLWREFMNFVSLLPEASHATFTSLGEGYSTTVSLKDLDHPRVLLVYAVEGEPLELAYGGPLRMVIPHLYGYKSAKWLGRIEFVDRMYGGFWEDRGYTRSGIIEPGSTLDVNTGVRKPIKGGEVFDF
ncbi:MAG: molybdopterin-dependent oxidoreductase [Desulfobacteraceae bacterium]|jgi:DMSO/TMAO reductase YedYZ molybdopterin-dependent catalytic subunit